VNALAMIDVIKNIRDLPALPVIVVELMGALDQEDSNTNALADRLSRDQALSAKTLRLANSSFYGMQSKVTTIQQAIAVLGFNSIRTLVTTAALIGEFSSNKDVTFDFQVFWRHSLASAICAKIVARHLNLNQDYAFMVGLLHDIGRLVLVTCSPEHYAKVILYRDQKDCYLLDAEQAVLGTDHTIVGSALAAHWKFPVIMQKAIANHHAPGTDDIGLLAAIAHFGDCVVHALDVCGDDQDLVLPMSASIWKKFNLGQSELAEIYHNTEIQFDEASKILLKVQE